MIDAERLFTVARSEAAALLQWGRVVIDAERFYTVVAGDTFLGLQWGRVVIDAESRCWRTVPLTRLVLQWGRVVIDAESLQPPSGDDPRDAASMGPRRDRRGEALPNAPSRSPPACFNGAAS